MIHSNIKNDKPLPGDVVFVANLKEGEIKQEMIGLIEGVIGETADVMSIRFDPIFPADIKDGVVIVKGGFQRQIKSSQIFTKHSGKTNIKMLFNRKYKYHHSLDLVKRMFVII